MVILALFGGMALDPARLRRDWVPAKEWAMPEGCLW